MKTLSRAIQLILLWSVCTLAFARIPLQVEIEGLSGRLLDNARALLSIERVKDHPDLAAGRVHRLYEKAGAEIKLALEPFGYYRPTIHSQLEKTASGWIARYRVEPGPRLPVRTLDIRLTGAGTEDPVFSRLLQHLPLRQGDAFTQQAYERTKHALQKLAAERGYFDAVFITHKVLVDLQSYSAKVSLHFDTGRRYEFGPVSFGTTVLSPDFLAGYVPFEQGQPYSTDALLRLQNGLSDSDYFEYVEVEPLRGRASGLQVPIHVKLIPRKRTKYTLGLGYGTDTGVRGSIGMERRYINRRGHRFVAELKASQIRDSLEARYIVPMRDPLTDRLVVRAQWLDDHPKTSHSNTTLLGIDHERSAGLWRQTQSLTYQRDTFRVGDETGRSALLIPGVGWTRIKGDNPVFVTHGSRIGVIFRGASDSLGSDVSFVQARAQAKFIRKLGHGRVIARGEAGWSWVPEFTELPPSVRFFAGGDQSVRGYGYNTLGPTDDQGNVIGGRDLLVGSLEYDHKVTTGWRAAVFYDVGNALNSFAGRLERGAGFGIRWRSPIGWVRVDLASALSRAGRPWRLHLTLGPDL